MPPVRIATGPRSFPTAWGALVALAATMLAPVAAADDLRPDYRPAAQAIEGAKLLTMAGEPIEKGTIVVRDGVIVAIGPAVEVEVPFNAEVIDGEGLVVYPGFIDLYTTLGVPANAVRSQTGPARTVPYAEFALPSTPPDNRHGLTPEFEVASVLDLTEATAEARRKQGFTALLSAPGSPIAGGQSALVGLGGQVRREAVIKSPVGLHLILRMPVEPPPPGDPEEPPAVSRRRNQGIALQYPMSLMGVVAHLRQAMLDADYHRDRLAYYREHGGSRPPFDPSLDALLAAKEGRLGAWWEANTEDEIHRALDLADEFGTSAVIVGGREAAKVADRLKERNVPVILRVNLPEKPKVPVEADFRDRPPAERTESLRVLRDREARWEERAATAAALAKAGVRFAFASDGLDKPESFHAKVRILIAAGLAPEVAAAALSRDAAGIVGLGDRLGTLEVGKLGHIVALSGDYGDESAKVRYVLIDGRKFEVEKKAKPADPGAGPKPEAGKPKPDPADPAGTPAAVESTPVRAVPPAAAEPAQEKPARTAQEPRPDEPKPPMPATEDDHSSKGPFVDVSAELAEDRKPTIKTGGDVLIRGLTILPGVGPTIIGGSILVRDGKVAAIGRNLAAPAGVAVIEAAGLVAMPGIIDTHSHMAIAGGSNEFSLSIVPEVRVADAISADDPAIYRALAGGTTAARLLHGSANVIGGQDAVIKLRAGRPARELLVREGRSHQGVKFALGENVTRRIGRFPNSRPGVEAVLERAFEAGRDYRDEVEAARKAREDGEPRPPLRRDLRLEALARVMDGSIKIHSHCYRADEILMLLRTAERYDVKVQSLQHVLEGYKVALEIAAHGAACSTFSDWWAYKVEAFDATAYNAALLTEAGARVSIKSDDEELVRHLYLEAAKMVRYGGASEADALAMITINPARELGLEGRMGSIEVGKDADIAIFNAHPFDTYARCELALIDGEVAFQRDRSGAPLAPRAGSHAAMPRPEAPPGALEIADRPGESYAIVGATIHPVSGPVIAAGVIVIDRGRIAAVGGPETPIPSDATTVAAGGLDAWPGMIEAGTPLGLVEVGSLGETQDLIDSATYQPELRASAAIKADSELIPVTRAGGVLSAVVWPFGGAICGQGVAIDLAGWVAPEMVVADQIALHVNIPAYRPIDPEAPPRTGDGPDPAARRAERLEQLRDQFRRAAAYADVVDEARERKATPPPHDPRLAALAPYARGEKPVVFRAERAVEILDALAIARDLELKAILSGGMEAWKVAEAIKDADVPVIIGGTLRLPLDRADPYDAPFANPARLAAAGVTFAIRSAGLPVSQVTSGRNLPFEAGVAVAFGLDEEKALEAITLAPAKILGIDGELGSLEVGKRANVVLTAGPLLQVGSEIKALFVDGRPIAPESRQSRLYDTYRRRLDEVRAGTAKLGLERPDPPSGRPSATAP